MERKRHREEEATDDFASQRAAVTSIWCVAEELYEHGCALEAIQLLHALILPPPSDEVVAAIGVPLPLPVALRGEDFATRIRIGEMIVDSNTAGSSGATGPKVMLAPEAARRVVEPCLRSGYLSFPTITSQMRARCFRVLCCAARRRAQFATAVQFLHKCLEEVKVMEEQGDTEAMKIKALARVEGARIHFSRALASHFSDQLAVDDFVNCTADFAQLINCTAAAGQDEVGKEGSSEGSIRAASITLSVCHVLGLVFAGKWERASGVLRTCDALFGSFSEFSALQALVNMSIGVPPPGAASVAAQQGWLSPPVATAMRILVELLVAASVSSHDELAAKFTELVHATDEAMSKLNASVLPDVGEHSSEPRLSSLPSDTSPSTIAAASQNSETRLLVGAKVAAYLEVAAADMTRLYLCGAAGKLEALCNFVIVFHKHTLHFRAHLHMVIACLALLLQAPTACEQHLDAAQNVPELSKCESLTVRLLRAHLFFTRRYESVDAAQKYDALLDDLTAEHLASDGSVDAGWTHRVWLMLSLLRGARFIDRHDYPSAISILKELVGCSRKFFGVDGVLTGQALRLLGLAHNLEGNTESSEVAVTTATQLTKRSLDQLNLVHCLQWTVGHFAVVSEADRKKQSELNSVLNNATSMYAQQLASANAHGEGSDTPTSRTVAFVLGFLPQRDDYKRWVAKATTK